MKAFLFLLVLTVTAALYCAENPDEKPKSADEIKTIVKEYSLKKWGKAPTHLGVSKRRKGGWLAFIRFSEAKPGGGRYLEIDNNGAVLGTSEGM